MTISRTQGLLDLEAPAGVPAIVHAEAGDPERWVAQRRAALRALACERGAVLVRGLGLDGEDLAGRVSRLIVSGTMVEREGFAPRRHRGQALYSSSEWPADQPMCMHHELSYRLEFPRLLVLACLEAPILGGATALADAAAVLRALPQGLVERFEREGWRLVRHYNGAVGVSAAESFGSDSRADIERYCRAAGIDWRWLPGGCLRTEQHRPAVVRHPLTGERCWFNQVAFLNEWTMDPQVREFLVEEFGGEQGLPFNTFSGDGAPVDRETVALINAVYEEHARAEPWLPGDLLVVDNVRMAHSREPYEGSRRVVVTMGEAVRLRDCLDGAAGA